MYKTLDWKSNGWAPYWIKNWDHACEKYFRISEVYIDKFFGDVLYVGMGTAYGPRNQSDKVKSTTIIEKYNNIIDDFNLPEKQWNIINDCAYEVDLKNNKYDFIYIDIWTGFIPKEEFNILNKKYSKHLKKNGELLISKILPFK